MNAVQQFGRKSPYSARNIKKPVSFIYFGPEATEVAVAGEFSGWHHIPLQKQPDGAWTGLVEVSHGHHKYLLVVDGEPMLDPRAQGKVKDEEGNYFSLIAIS